MNDDNMKYQMNPILPFPVRRKEYSANKKKRKSFSFISPSAAAGSNYSRRLFNHQVNKRAKTTKNATPPPPIYRETNCDMKFRLAQ